MTYLKSQQISDRAGVENPGALTPTLACFFYTIIPTFLVLSQKLNGIIQVKPMP